MSLRSAQLKETAKLKEAINNVNKSLILQASYESL